MDRCNHPTQTNSSKPELKIYYGTSQSWSGGAIGAGKGTNYRFYLSATDSTYGFDSVWINGYRLALKKRNDYSSGDTLVLDALAFFPGSRPIAPEGSSEKKGAEEAAMPCCAGASFVIRYIFNNNKDHLTSDELKILPRINYP